MAAFDAFAVVARAPRRLWLLNVAVHGALALALLHALLLGLQPTAALGCGLVVVLLHAVHEHRRLAAAPRRMRIQGGEVFLDDGEQPWRLSRVSCATRSVLLAEIVDDARRRQWLCLGGDQLDSRDLRRVLRWLRAGVPDQRLRAPVGLQRRRSPARGQPSAELSAAGVRMVSRASASRPG